MSLKRDVSLGTGLRYRGGSPYLTYILHRIGGSALFIFFTLYILSLLGIGFASALFHNWVIQIILIVLGLFHAINGLRITILDLFPKWIEHFRTAINIEWAAYILVTVLVLFVVLRNTFGG